MKTIKDYPNYSATKDGRVYSHIHHKFLKPHFSKSRGYWYVGLYNGKGRRVRTVHKIIAETFLPNPNNLPYINHIDFDRGNNKSSNLEWCTAKENNWHSVDNGRANFNAKITEDQVREIRAIGKSQPYKVTAEQYGLTKQMVYYIISRHSWTHI